LGYTKKYPNFRYEQEKNQGLSHSRNKGWKSAHGTYVAYIDDDAKAIPEWAEKIVDTFANITPPPTAVGGEIHPWYESAPPEWFEDKFEIRTWGEKPHFLDSAKAR
ncbi:glycosyltransferase, partial [Arthrospira platensis SPKY1]|nr:glycosyltransferase [Arthrospira platensis SPKY1]